MIKLKVTQIGNSVGLILPKEALSKLNVGKGDSLILVESPNGYVVTPFDQEFEEEMAIGEKYSRRYRNALRELAK